LSRLILFGGAAPLGLLTGLVAWLLAGGLSVQAQSLSDLEAKLATLRPPKASSARVMPVSIAALQQAPLFALTTGPGAVREPSVRVDGVSFSRRRKAALVSVDGKPAEWLDVGASRDGVTLQEVSSAGVVIETAVGTKQLALGEQSAASSPAPGGSPAAGAVSQASPAEQPPPGVRLPPEPASAPQGG